MLAPAFAQINSNIAALKRRRQLYKQKNALPIGTRRFLQAAFGSRDYESSATAAVAPQKRTATRNGGAIFGCKKSTPTADYMLRRRRQARE